MRSRRAILMVCMVVLALLLSTAACATFRSPDDPLPTAPPTLTPSPATVAPLTPTAHLTLTPTSTFTPTKATNTGR